MSRRFPLWVGGWGVTTGPALCRPPLPLAWAPPSFLLPCPAFHFGQYHLCLLSHLCFLAFWFLLTWPPGVGFYLSEENFLSPLPPVHSQGHTACLLTTSPKGSQGRTQSQEDPEPPRPLEAHRVSLGCRVSESEAGFPGADQPTQVTRYFLQPCALLPQTWLG